MVPKSQFIHAIGTPHRMKIFENKIQWSWLIWIFGSNRVEKMCAKRVQKLQMLVPFLFDVDHEFGKYTENFRECIRIKL